MKPKKNQRVFNIGTVFAFGHLALLFLIQIENYCFYIFQPKDGFLPLISFFISLPFLQLENSFFALLLFLLSFPLLASRYFKWSYWVLAGLCNLYLIIDQVAYKIFFDHLQFSMLEGGQDLAFLGSSTLAEIDGFFYLNLFFFIFLTVLNAKILSPHKLPDTDFHPLQSFNLLLRSPRFNFFLVGFVTLSILVISNGQYNHLQQHPLLSLVRNGISSYSKEIKNVGKIPDFTKHRFGVDEESIATKIQLQQIANEIRQWEKKTNVIFIVIESVGSKQLFKDGEPSPSITPVLHGLSQNSLLFDSVYSIFPGSTRSNMAMCTGGRFITWGSVYKELSYPYQGPTMAKEFKKLGYNTALFSSAKLAVENLEGFINNPGYDTRFDFGKTPPEFLKAHKLSEWGGDDAPVMSKAMDWVDSIEPEKPFFLHFLTNVTHHPYAIPKEYKGPMEGSDNKSKYLNTLHYTDFVLGQMIQRLKKNNSLKDTLIVITGDHGEAFGELHRRNLTHKNFLYEENVKSFLMIANPSRIKKSVVSHRIGTMGDIMPTILSLVNAGKADVLGQDLLSDYYDLKIVFFHKNAGNELWGLRDGKWKYIAAKLGGEMELYDLQADPYEEKNLAGQHPEKTALYEKLMTNWYIEVNREFVDRLKGFKHIGGRGLQKTEIRTPGPKILAFGYYEEKDDEEEFVEAQTFHPLEKVVAWTKWVTYPEDQLIYYEWVSPAGKVHAFDFNVKPDWSFTWVQHGVSLPMEEGVWRLTLKVAKKTFISGEFTVSGSAKLHGRLPLQHKVKKKIQLVHSKVLPQTGKSIAVGKVIYVKDKDSEGEMFVKMENLRPKDKAVVWTRWKPVNYDRKIRYRWASPSEQIYQFYFTVKSGWNQSWVNYNGPLPMEKGGWKVSLLDQGKKTFSISFTIKR